MRNYICVRTYVPNFKFVTRALVRTGGILPPTHHPPQIGPPKIPPRLGLMFSIVLDLVTLFWFCFLCVYFGHVFFLQKIGTNQLRSNFPGKIAVTSVTGFILKWANCGCIQTMIICIFHKLPNKLSFSYKLTVLMRITTLFPLSLLFCISKFPKKRLIF